MALFYASITARFPPAGDMSETYSPFRPVAMGYSPYILLPATCLPDDHQAGQADTMI